LALSARMVSLSMSVCSIKMHPRTEKEYKRKSHTQNCKWLLIQKNRCMQKTCLLALFVKVCLEWPAGHDKHEIKNKFSAEYGQSETEAILK